MLLGACLCMFVDWVFGALRFHIFIRIVKPDIRFWDSLRANLATLCVSCITPFQTGGVGHLYIYARAGVPLSGAITSGIICFLSTITTLIFFAVGIAGLDPPFLSKGATWLSLLSCVMFSLAFVGFLLLLFKPEIVFRFFIGSAMLHSGGSLALPLFSNVLLQKLKNLLLSINRLRSCSCGTINGRVCSVCS